MVGAVLLTAYHNAGGKLDLAAIDFAAEHLHIHMEKTVPVCTRSAQNNQCIGKRCPFMGGKK